MYVADGDKCVYIAGQASRQGALHSDEWINEWMNEKIYIARLQTYKVCLIYRV